MSEELPEAAYAIALTMAPAVGPATLRALLQDDSPSVAWSRASDGSGQTAGDVAAIWEHHVRLGISVLLRSDPHYPRRLRGDPEAPAILFCLGDPVALLPRAAVAVVGTRAPTRYGIGVAAQLGADLAAAGVSVVSGLALGIDAAAHEGACGAGVPPIGVVAGGLDQPYPRRNARLWARVAAEGAIVSESPAGAQTEKWRFPVRNRLLAALSDVVVVVESRHHGGSRHTVEAALARAVPVGAVPGSIRSATSEGTNALLAEGAFPVCSAADVLVSLSLEGAVLEPPSSALMAEGDEATEDRTTASTRPRFEPASEEERLVFEALTSDPAPLDDLLRATGLSLPALCGALERLAQAGQASDAGGWWERT